MRRFPTLARSPCAVLPHISFLLLFLLAAFLTAAQSTRAEAGCPDGLMTPDDAGTGSLLLRTSTAGRYLPAPRVATDIDVHASGAVARTRLTQRFENPADGWVEGIYVFPLPEGAAVDTMKMQIGSRFLEGQIKERQEARAIYEKAKTNGKKASLIEQERPNIFQNRVANIGPHEIVTIQIEYQENVRFDSRKYRLRVPLVVAPRYTPSAWLLVACGADNASEAIFGQTANTPPPVSPILPPAVGKTNPVRLAVHIVAGFPLGEITSENHPINVMREGKSSATLSLREAVVPADRDFVLDFAPVPDAMPAVSLLKEHVGDSDYVLAQVLPPAKAVVRIQKPREAIFVLDNSGSMAGESIRQAKESLLLALGQLAPKDRFNVIRFDDTYTKLFSEPVDATPANVGYAKGFVEGIDAGGGTEMLAPLLAALADPTPADTSRLRQVIFLTDGEVGNEAELFAAIRGKLGRSRLFTVGIGSAPNGYFMGGAARAGRGTYTYIGAREQVSPKMAELFAKLERPVMTDVSAHWPDGFAGEAWPNPLPDLYEGEPIVVAVKTPKAAGTLALTGTLAGKPWKATIDLSAANSASGIEKLWARSKIAALEESRVDGTSSAEIDKSVLEVALEHHLTSRLTSLVAVDITPTRPNGADLRTAQMPLNLPAGWDFGKLMGEHDMPQLQHADLDVSPALIKTLSVGRGSSAAIRPEEASLVLPQGGTESTLLFLVGSVLLTISGALMLAGSVRRQDTRG